MFQYELIPHQIIKIINQIAVINKKVTKLNQAKIPAMPTNLRLGRCTYPKTNWW